MNRSIVLAALVSAVLGAPAAAAAQPGPALPTPQFIRAAAQTDEFERQEGRLAAARARSPEVREFGRMMVRDHTRTTEALKAAIRRAGLPVPALPPLTQEEHANLTTLTGAPASAFDRVYLNQQIAAHVAALDVMRAYAAAGADKVLRGAAAGTVPIVERHLARARALAAR